MLYMDINLHKYIHWAYWGWISDVMRPWYQIAHMNGSEDILFFINFFFLLMLQRRVCRPYICVCVCVFFMFIHHRANYSHSLLWRRHQETRVDRLSVHKATKKGNIVCTCNSERRQSWRSVFLFPTVCVCLIFFFFVLMSTPRSGLDPPPLAHVWYIDVYYTETLSSVHWRLKYTHEICVPGMVEFPSGQYMYIYKK